MKRLSWKTKIILSLIALVVASTALVAMFGAGFATGTILARTGAQDECDSVGTWDAEHKICMVEKRVAETPVITPAAATTTVSGGYTCGDGTRFTLQDSGNSAVIDVDGGSVRTLQRVSATGFDDGEVSLRLDGPDAQYVNRLNGRTLACTKAN